jgi:L-serine dehydratase
MKSLLEIYRIGRGPSSSHTIGPARAAERFHMENAGADSVRVVLRGSLAMTGRGHQTDRAVREALAPLPCEVVFDPSDPEDLPHPNTMDFTAYKDGAETASIRVLSTGGGAFSVVGRPDTETKEVYPERSFREIAAYCKARNLRLAEYVGERAGRFIWDYLSEIWQVMKRSVYEGLTTGGILPGGLGVERKAQYLFNQRHIDESESTRENRLVCAYAFAASEQNADGGVIVTAPTCGACGVLPAALLYMQEKRRFSDEQVLRALAAGGIIGNLIKTNASISGAECGCQAEIGSACSMTAAALGELFGMGIDQIEYAAEVAMEHHLGLTCDPIQGLVQIPCIERNAVAAMRAINALSLANFLSSTRKISFDLVVETMYETGRDMSCCYRETAEGGLAKLYRSS